MFYTLTALVFYILGYYTGRNPPFIKPEHSELSDPTVNKPPFWFYKWNYRALHMMAYYSWFGNPEFTAKQLASKEAGFFGRMEEMQEIIVKDYSRRLWELANMGYLNVRREKMDVWYRNHFSINEKGRKMYLKYKTHYEK